ncbi:hypothetical protein MES5069_530071 [Mesorhizobium escarrei]|uniref:Transposase n=1 Tax=Mesorhizobium escarrei TaxID=666018 RepID=A0ABN8K8U4_9HYPH|nr:hypothetical protein MES5069_530071 [Mesorhizobium escarrei]
MWPAVLMSVAAAHNDMMRGCGWTAVPRASSMSPRIFNRYKDDGLEALTDRSRWS